ncbi:MAG: TrkA family potassium uptake protein, partial [Lachnospiraceae bacterium]|nr:TrkA family potassium uptake protein [Lachnospiraceae bacterium]
MGLGSVDTVIIAMGENLEASIMAAMVAKEVGVNKVIAKASSKRMAEILLKIGADEIIFPEEDAAFRTAKSLLSDTFLDYYDLGDHLSLVEMYPKPAWIGQTLKELNLRKREGLNVVAIREKGGSFVHINGDTVLTETSEMLIVAEKKKLRKLDSK